MTPASNVTVSTQPVTYNTFSVWSRKCTRGGWDRHAGSRLLHQPGEANLERGHAPGNLLAVGIVAAIGKAVISLRLNGLPDVLMLTFAGEDDNGTYVDG